MKQTEASLAALLAGVVVVDPTLDRSIKGISLDSRTVKAGDLFIAIPGNQIDGRQFIPEAIEKGASAVFTASDADEVLEADTLNGAPIFYHRSIEQQIGKIAARFYQHPSRGLHVVGVTGTNGKTSTTHFIAEALAHLNKPQHCGVVGTLGYGSFNKKRSSGLTTPDAITLQQILAEFVDLKWPTVAMEVSSHALVQGRCQAIEFDTAVFTNLTRDHLDYHGTMEAYAEAKLRLFKQFNLKHAVINRDDGFAKTILDQLKGVEPLTYALDRKADVYAKQVQLGLGGIMAEVHSPFGSGMLHANLLGRFNVSNLLAVLSVLLLMDIPFTEALNAVSKVSEVAGRMQTLLLKNEALAVVDYSHTPDSLAKALTNLRAHCRGQLICLFGCGGDRDGGKRPLMAEVAERLADKVILTNDNPRFEDPEKIIADIKTGLQDSAAVKVILDRKAAIAYSLDQASPGDIVLIAGKGHETTQIIADKTLPLSDIEQVRSWQGN